MNVLERRLVIEPVDGVSIWKLEGPGSRERRWQLRRGSEVLAETKNDDHELAWTWIDALKRGQVPSATPTSGPPPTSQPAVELESEQLELGRAGSDEVG